MKLYYSPGTCSLSPHIVLREAGLSFELEKVDRATRQTESGADYLAVNPKGYVPALRLDNGEVLTEGPAIVQYLADLAPAKNLAPPNGTLARYRLQEWLNFISAELHKAYGALFNPNASEEWKASARKLIGARLSYTAKQLEGKTYLMDDTFSVADAYLFTILSWGEALGVDNTRWPVMPAYAERIAVRPAVQAAMQAEGLLGSP